MGGYMRKLVLILLVSIAVVTFIRAYDNADMDFIHAELNLPEIISPR